MQRSSQGHQTNTVQNSSLSLVQKMLAFKQPNEKQKEPNTTPNQQIQFYLVP